MPDSLAHIPPATQSRRGRRGAVEGVPHPVDVHVGARLRTFRLAAGLSMGELANAMNISHQQLQKYETGANKLTSGRLFDITRILRVPVSSFFDGFEDDADDPFQIYRTDPTHRRETLEFVRAFSAIGDAAIQQQLVNLINAAGPSS